TFSAFFAGTETAILSLSRGKIRSLFEQKKPGAAALYKIRQNPHRILITLLIGNCLANTAAAAVTTEVAIRLFGSSGVGIATGVATLLVLVFAEITPKSFALANSETISLLSARPVQILEILFYPAVWVFEAITRFVNKLNGEKIQRVTEEELRSVISMSGEEGLLDTDATKRLQSVLDFEKTTVNQIMTPKASVVSFSADQTVQEFLDHPHDAPFDRYPLFHDSQNKIIGVLDVIDVIRTTKEEKFSTKLADIMRPTFFVKQNTRLDEILPIFRPKKSSMGVVVNDKEEMVGIFTSQDIVEEVVGDILEEEVYRHE
ncbi:MAG TPA: CNNM domain-containing protein, partial [Candidatus Saccharimonadales bacterium]|nr:CNNM domain-containing protein [Candidatus Saccharimonadales bacterium]